jgi:hypothetical protein
MKAITLFGASKLWCSQQRQGHLDSTVYSKKSLATGLWTDRRGAICSLDQSVCNGKQVNSIFLTRPARPPRLGLLFHAVAHATVSAFTARSRPQRSCSLDERSRILQSGCERPRRPATACQLSNVKRQVSMCHSVKVSKCQNSTGPHEAKADRL